MEKNVDLLQGSIAGTLAKLAFPIMGASLIQMAYNLVDMLWIGRISSNAVAAVGAAGMYPKTRRKETQIAFGVNGVL